MKKILTCTKYISLFVLIFLLTVSFSPKPLLAERAVVGYGYTKTIGGTVFQLVNSISLDSLNNIYITGIYTDTIDFDPSGSIDNHTSVGSGDIFLTKINADGSYGYTKTMEGVDYASGLSVTTDSYNNVYITGYFVGTFDFDSSGSVDNHTSAGDSDIFLTKINADGSYGYTKTIGGTGSDAGYGVNIDVIDNIYITGKYADTVDFDPSGSIDNHTSVGSSDIFLTKINADGSYGYTKTIGGTVYQLVNSISIDSLNNIYITGVYNDTVDFDSSGSIDNHTSVGGNDIFLTKINADGSYGYTKTIGGIDADNAYSVVTDALNNIYITGIYNDTVDFDPSGSIDNHTSVGSGDIFLTKINADGSYGYTKTIGSTNDEHINNMAVDITNNIYLTGYFIETIDFDPSMAEDNHIAAAEDIFLTKINADGSYGYTKTMGVINNTSFGKSIDIDSNNSIYLAGQFSGVVDFDPSGSIDNHTSVGGSDIFLTKFSQANYQHITSIGSTLTAEVSSSGDSVDDAGVDDGIPQDTVENIRIKDSTVPVADIDVTFSSDLDWSLVTGDTDTTTYKSFIHNLTTVDGADSSFTLYVPFHTGDTSVTVCPGATSLVEVTASCVSATSYSVGQAGVSIVTIGADSFWSIPNQTGTGGISIGVTATSGSTSGSRPRSSTYFTNTSNNTGASNTTAVIILKFLFSKNLKRGMLDLDIKELQKYLNTHGFIVATTGAGSVNNETIVFGRLTNDAVVKFQLANGLVPDGIVGPLTRGVINSSN